jgi:hypothetical protein
MTFSTFRFTVLAMATLSACARTELSNRTAVLPPGPVRTVTDEVGVVPAGTFLVIRTKDNVSARRELRGTIYDANIAEDVLDQNGIVLIPKKSPVELVVGSRSYFGPGGVGMTELILELRAVTVKGARYPVGTESGNLGFGGLGLDRDAARWVGGSAVGGEVLTSGPRINVPARTVLAFQIVDPIRLRGFNL